jgi:hypothetical protein
VKAEASPKKAASGRRDTTAAPANPLWSVLATHVPPVVQAKLEVGAPDDEYERQADRVADQVMRMPAGGPPGPPPEDEEDLIQGQATPSIGLLRRQPATLEEEQVLPGCGCVRRQGDGPSGGSPDKGSSVGPGTESRIESLRGRGEPLDAATRTDFEARFGRDFSRVQVHTGPDAGQLTRDLHARAFTSKEDIYFAPGRYEPHTAQGQRLLAHELTHTIQQHGVVRRRPALEEEEQKTNRAESAEATREAEPATSDYGASERASEVCESCLSPTRTGETLNLVPPATAMGGNVTAPGAQAGLLPSQSDMAMASAGGVALEGGLPESQAVAGAAIQETATQANAAEAEVRSGAADMEARVEGGRKAVIAQARSAAAHVEAEPLPSLVDLLRPTDEASSADLQVEFAGTTGAESQTPADIMSTLGSGNGAGTEGEPETEPSATIAPVLQGGSAEAGVQRESEYDPDVARVEVQSIAAMLATASTEMQRHIEMRADEVTENLTSSVETLRESVQTQVAASVAALRVTFATERASLDVSLETAQTQVATALAARVAQAVVSGQTAKGRLTSLFAQHRTNVETTVQNNVAAAEGMRNDYATQVREHTQAQATQARQRGQVKASSYPNTERGHVQANAARATAEETAREIEAREPDAVEAVREVTVGIPQEFQERGQRALDGFDERLPSLLAGVDQQVQSVTDALNEQASQAYQQLNTLGTQMRLQLASISTPAPLGL